MKRKSKGKAGKHAMPSGKQKHGHGGVTQPFGRKQAGVYGGFGEQELETGSASNRKRR